MRFGLVFTQRTKSGGKRPDPRAASKRRLPHARRLRLEPLEDRALLSVDLQWTPGGALVLTENTPGATPTITISEPSPSVNVLKVDLGSGKVFAGTSTTSATGLTYQNAGHPTTSQWAAIDISLTNNVTSVSTTLLGDGLTLGPIRDSLGGIGSITASAATIDVPGINTYWTNGNVDLRATGNLTVDCGAIIQTGTGTISLSADVNADNTGDDGVGTLSVLAGATVTSSNATASAITLRGADINVDTVASAAVVGAQRLLGSTAGATITGLSSPCALAVDGSGNLFVANNYNDTVSEFAPGATWPSATLTGLLGPDALAFDAAGNLYVANSLRDTVSKFAPGSTTPTATLIGVDSPTNLTFDGSGNLYVLSWGENTVTKFAAGATWPSATLTGLNVPDAVAVDGRGDVFVANHGSNASPGATVSEFFPGSTTPSVTLSGLWYPEALAFDSSGNLYVSNYWDTVSKFAPGSTTPTATLTGLNEPRALAFDGWGNLYVANYDGSAYSTVMEFAPASTVPSVIITGVHHLTALALDSGGDLYVANGSDNSISKFALGSTTPGETLTGLNGPSALAFDSVGNLYVANSGNNTVTEFAPRNTAPVATLTGLNYPLALAFDGNGDLYVANYGNGSGTTVSEFVPGSTTPIATLTGLHGPDALAFDGSGNLFVVNKGSNTVSKFASGSSTPSVTLAGLNKPDALAFDGSGNLYVANSGNNTVSEFAPGTTTPSATLTGVYAPGAVACDGSGNLYVANSGGSGAISKFAPGGTTPIATLAGGGPMTFDANGNLYAARLSGSDGVIEFAPGSTTPIATLWWARQPDALAFDNFGNLYIAQYYNLNEVIECCLGYNTRSSAGGVIIRSSLPTRPMSLGGTDNAVDGVNLTQDELDRIWTTASGAITIGDTTQTGNITLTTVTVATTAGASTVVVQAAGGPGQIILDDDDVWGPGLNGNGATVSLAPGTGGIVPLISRHGVPLTTNGFNATGLTLAPILNARPYPWTQFTLVENTATPADSNPITGEFANLPQGGTVTLTLVDEFTFQVNYAGGDGNDLVLTDVPPPAPTIVGLANDTGNTGDLITTDPTLTLNGDEAGAMLEYSFDDGATWWASASPPVTGPLTPVSVEVRQTDAASNVGPVSAPFSYTLDAPAVSSEYPSVTTVTTAQVGNTFVVTVYYNEPMWMLPAVFSPTVTFTGSTPEETAAINATLINGVKQWDNSLRFEEDFQIENAGAYVPHVHIGVAGGYDAVGNVPAPFQSTDDFAINMQVTPPTVVCAQASIQRLSLCNVSPGTDGFQVHIKYDPADAPLNTMLLASRPTITFVADTPELTAEVNATLIPDLANSTWSGSGSDYIAYYNVVNTGAVIPNVDMKIAGAQGAYSYVTEQWYDQERFVASGAFSVDMTKSEPIVSVQSTWGTYQLVTNAAASPHPDPLPEGEGTAPAYWVRINYAHPMSIGIQPTVTLNGSTSDETTAIRNAMSFSYGTWTSTQTYMAYYTVNGGTDVPMTGVYVGAAGAHDLVGNLQVPYQSTAAVFGLDTHDATPALSDVTSLGSSMQSITAHEIGSQMSLEIVYSQTMDISSSPTIQFLDGAGNPTGVPGATVYQNYPSSFWGSDHVYWAFFDIQNPYAGQDPPGIIFRNVGVQVTGARDITGRDQTTYQKLKIFDIDTLTPDVASLPSAVSVTPSMGVITDAATGEAKFYVRIDYSRPMWGGLAPEVSFVPDPNTTANIAALANTLTPFEDSSGWGNYDPASHGYTTYWQWYSVTDVNASIPYIGVKIRGAVDMTANPQQWFEGSGFRISMLDEASPLTDVGRIANPSYSDAVLASGDLDRSVTASSFTDQQSIAITPADYALLYSGTWLEV